MAIDQRIMKTSRGASLLEYALLIAMLAIACLVILQVLGGRISTQFSAASSLI